MLECNVSLPLKAYLSPSLREECSRTKYKENILSWKKVTNLRLLTLTWVYSSPDNFMVFEGEMCGTYKIYEGKKVHI